MEQESERELIVKSDKAIKDVLRKYGVKDSDLTFCTMELLMVFIGIMKSAERLSDGNS
jgi:hypothetical protein